MKETGQHFGISNQASWPVARVGDVYRRGNTTITVEGIYDAGWLELRSVSLLPGGKEVITSWAESPASFRQRGATLIRKG